MNEQTANARNEYSPQYYDNSVYQKYFYMIERILIIFLFILKNLQKITHEFIMA